MKRLIMTVSVFLAVMSAGAQMKWNQQFQNYINKYCGIAVQEMQKYHIPASITLAQGIFESGAGNSELCLKGNNHFGIKCHGWTGRTVYHDDDESQECFRAYNSALESYEDHSKFLVSSQRYRSLFQLSVNDNVGWARGLKACGYATNPQYADKLIQLIELYKLYEFDRGGKSKGGKTVVTPQDEHVIRIYNRNLYLIARQGDTFRSLSKETGISRRKLAKYNERDKDDVLSEGDIIYLKKKRSRADKAFKKHPHVVKAGDSMYSIAQQYGIRLKSLYKMNQLEPDYQIRVGDKLRVY